MIVLTLSLTNNPGPANQTPALHSPSAHTIWKQCHDSLHSEPIWIDRESSGLQESLTLTPWSQMTVQFAEIAQSLGAWASRQLWWELKIFAEPRTIWKIGDRFNEMSVTPETRLIGKPVWIVATSIRFGLWKAIGGDAVAGAVGGELGVLKGSQWALITLKLKMDITVFTNLT